MSTRPSLAPSRSSITKSKSSTSHSGSREGARRGTAVPVLGVPAHRGPAGNLEEYVEQGDVRRSRDGEGLYVEEQLTLDQVAEQPVGGHRRPRTALRSVVSMSVALTVNDNQASGGPLDERLRLGQLRDATDRSLRQAGVARRSLGTDPIGDAVGGGGDLAGGDAVGRQRRPVWGEHVGVAGRRAEVVQLVEQAVDLDADVDPDLLQRVATQLACWTLL
jgi:hypothetical protein